MDGDKDKLGIILLDGDRYHKHIIYYTIQLIMCL